VARSGRVSTSMWSGDGRVDWRYPTTKTHGLTRKLERVVGLVRFSVQESHLTIPWLGAESLASHGKSREVILGTTKPDQPDHWVRKARMHAASRGQVGSATPDQYPTIVRSKPDHTQEKRPQCTSTWSTGA
jgi:hypothetical protein